MFRGLKIFSLIILLAPSAKSQISTNAKYTENPRFTEFGFRIRNYYSEFLQQSPANIETGETTFFNIFYGGGIFQHYGKKQILYRFSTNYYKRIQKISTFSENNLNRIQNESINKTTFIEVIPGIGKTLSIKKFTFKIGCELPITFPFLETETYETKATTTSNNSLIKEGYEISKTVKKIKLQAFTDLEYKFSKHIFLEVGMANGFLIKESKGERRIYSENYENHNLISRIERKTSINDFLFAFDFYQLYFGINYRF